MQCVLSIIQFSEADLLSVYVLCNKSDHLTNYLGLTFMIDSGDKLSTIIQHDFDFDIVNFPFLSSNIPPGLFLWCIHITTHKIIIHNAAHFTITLDIATSAWLIDFCHIAVWPWGLRGHLRNFMADLNISLRNIRGQSRKW